MKIRIKHKTILLAIISSAGVVATGIAAAKAVPKAIKLQEKAEQKKGSELTKKEKIKASIPAYILPTVFGAATITCIMGNSILSERQQASLASAYGLLSTTYTKYRNKVREIYGEEAHQEIMRAIMVDPDHKIWGMGLGGPVDTTINDDDEVCLFYDALSNRYFESTKVKVLEALFHLNRNYVLGGLWVDVNTWYYMLGIPKMSKFDELCWASLGEVSFIDYNMHKAPLEEVPVEASNNYLECYVIEFVFDPMTEEEYENY